MGRIRNENWTKCFWAMINTVNIARRSFARWTVGTCLLALKNFIRLLQSMAVAFRLLIASMNDVDPGILSMAS